MSDVFSVISRNFILVKNSISAFGRPSLGSVVLAGLVADVILRSYPQKRAGASREPSFNCLVLLNANVVFFFVE
jgi:hypothetical protein